MKLTLKDFKLLVESKGLDEAIDFADNGDFVIESKKLRKAINNYTEAQDQLCDAENMVDWAENELEELLGV